MVVPLMRFLVKSGLGGTLEQRVTRERVVLEWTWGIGAYFCGADFFGFERKVRLPLLAVQFVGSHLGADVIVAWSRDHVTFVLACISEVYFL
jgi:hypothetical protein